ncbi:hypothetical protein PmNV_067 [Penaeus monodon nudivirus]|uniref:Uncharacterized protein n=1 Tax=Penaeus monodon nudivirus TaxID=1529056 RepID=A0A076FE02_9VIRU|nr:hypothetical protein PmNV_067 [Penaeus monodon nudivirus]AII15855.1 hypothetical protein PmNV_067 [Penaeus monodon nudivirus]
MQFKSDVYITGAFQGDILSKGIHDEVYLLNQEEYGVVLVNKTNRRMKAEIQIAGNHAGTFVVMGNSKVVIQRPIDVDKKFQYVTLDSLELDQIQHIKNMAEFNLVQVVVKYEKDEIPESNISSRGIRVEVDGMDSGRSTVDGGTILSKNSSGQRFKKTTNFDTIDNYDSFNYVLLTKHEKVVSSSGFIIDN